MTDTPTGETVVDTKNDANNPTVTPAPAVDATEVEKLRKEKEQAEMRANQLANQLKAKEEADAQAKAKELEENNQFKDLYEQTQAKLEAVEAEKEETQRKTALTSTKNEVLSGFSADVKELAEELGLDLSSTDETEVETFKNKLTRLAEKAANGGTNITPNNPAPRTSVVELSQDELREGLSDEDKFHDIVTKRFPGIASMTNQPRQ